MDNKYLFRGLTIDGRGFTYGYLFYKPTSDNPFIMGVAGNIDWECKAGTIGQCVVGLKDKLGNALFEGDIVVAAMVGVIEYDKGLFGVNWDYGTDKKTMEGMWGNKTNLRNLYDGHVIGRLEVVGNIYEHPHMLDFYRTRGVRDIKTDKE